jgi:hypothetical protein
MKLLAASTALFATLQAQTIETLVGELVGKIYQVSDDGKTYTFNLAPYFQSVYECTGNGWNSKGTFGNGNGVIEYSDSASYENGELNYQSSVAGTVKSHPMAAMFPEEVLSDTITNELVVQANADGFSWNYSGTVNNIPWTNEIDLKLDAVTVTNKKISADMSFSRNFDIPSSINQYWRDLSGMFNGQTDVQMTVTAKKACGDSGFGPLHKSCSAKVTITGSNNGEDFGTNVVKYSVSTKKAQITVTHNKNEVFWLGLVGIDTLEVIGLKYKLNGGKAVLIIQILGPEGTAALGDAFYNFVTPFEMFFTAIAIMPGTNTAHAIAYADKVCNHIQGRDYFNVYPMIKATQFESDVLANAFKVKSIQSAAKKACNSINEDIERFARDAAPVISDARGYVNGVTGSSGESKFDSWFASLQN